MKRAKLLKKGFVVTKGLTETEIEILQSIYKGELEIKINYQTNEEIIIPSPGIDIRDVALNIGELFEVIVFIPKSLSLAGCVAPLP